METTTTLIAGAAISIITMAIQRLYDFITITKTHNLNLKKEYFLRKLQVFEKATSYYTNSHLSITTLSMLLKTTTKQNVDFDPKTMDEMLREIQSNMKAINNNSQELALALPLYTDLKLPLNDEDYVSKYFELIGEINAHGMMVHLADNAIANATTPSDRDKFEQVFDEELIKMEEKIRELYATSKIVKAAYTALTRELRLQLVKYEH